MIRYAFAAALLVFICRAEAQASTITFSGSILPEGDAALSFSGKVSGATGTVDLSYFLNSPTSSGPIVGRETITGPASFYQAHMPFPPDGRELDLTIENGSTFELMDTLKGGVTVSFNDPSRGLSLNDRADLSGFKVSNVPLPAAAPLFGAALLSLAGIGYCMRSWGAPKIKNAAVVA